MAEAELISELLVVILDGLQDKKQKPLREHYEKFEPEGSFPQKRECVAKFKHCLGIVKGIFGDRKMSEFRRRPLSKAIAEARVKMDKLDAKTLAYLLRGNLVAESYVPNKKNRMRRSLLRHRASLIKMRVEVKNRIHMLLDKYDLSYEYTDLFGKEGLEWLRSLSLPALDQHILQSNLQVLETLTTEIRSTDIQIAKDAVNEEQAKLLMTMPGVDYYAAMILLSEIGDVKRFASPEKLVSWVGLAPQAHQSGETHWTGHITRKGSKRARWILTQWAQVARQHDPRMSEFYERIERKHGPSKAIIAVARKMLSIMHVMLTRNEPYQGENRQLTALLT